MADVPTLEPADKAKAEKPKDGAAPSSGGKKKLLIFIAAGVAVLAGAGAGGWLIFSGKHVDARTPAAANQANPKAAPRAGKTKEVEKDEPAPKGPPIYVPLEPPFVVNFEVEQNVRFLQVAAQVMTRDPQIAELLKANDPMIRNDMLMLLGNQDQKTVGTREGKETLRAQALETVRKVVTSAGGKPKRVEAVYFTSFVMQ